MMPLKPVLGVGVGGGGGWRVKGGVYSLANCHCCI